MSYYHNTKQALLSAFDLRGVKCKGMQFNYEQDYPTVNRYTTEPSSFDERLAQDAMVRRSIREAMTEEEYITLMFCYTQNLEDIERSWINAVYPAILKTSKIAKMIGSSSFHMDLRISVTGLAIRKIIWSSSDLI